MARAVAAAVRCISCGSEEGVKTRCSSCKVAVCSRKCQKLHWSSDSDCKQARSRASIFTRSAAKGSARSAAMGQGSAAADPLLTLPAGVFRRVLGWLDLRG